MMSLSDEDLLASATDLTADAKFHINDIKASIAAMSFILSASGRVELGCPERGPAPRTPRRDPDVLGVGAGRG